MTHYEHTGELKKNFETNQASSSYGVGGVDSCCKSTSVLNPLDHCEAENATVHFK